MDLKDFVRSTLVQLAEAIVEADKELISMSGLVNPVKHTFDGKGRQEPVAPRTAVKFDIAVSASSEDQGKGGAKAKIVVLEIGGEATESKRAERVSRVSFSLDVVLPFPKDQKARVGLVATDSPPVGT